VRCCDVCESDAALVAAVSVPLKATSGRRGRSGGASTGAGGKGAPAGPPVDEEHFERLRAWRYERAEGKPAYTVASNAVLEELLRATPHSTQALLEIRGIGPAFCKKHGESLLAELAALAPGDDAATQQAGEPPQAAGAPQAGEPPPAAGASLASLTAPT
jgi:superfamily II DNA helicase RecQ